MLYFSRSYSTRKTLPWTPPDKNPNFHEIVSKTLFGQRYLSTTVDEAHEFRNVGPKHIALLELLDLSVVRLIGTATPLLTSNAVRTMFFLGDCCSNVLQDTAAMGRLVGLPHFFTEESSTEERADTANLRRAKRELPPDYDSENEDEDNPYRLCQVEISLRHQTQFQGRIIRRTRTSKTCDGDILIKLPPCVSILAFLQLTDREMEIISSLTDMVRDRFEKFSLIIDLG